MGLNSLTLKEISDYSKNVKILNSYNLMHRKIGGLTKFLFTLFLLLALALLFTPWQQTSYGLGRVLSLDSEKRPQFIQATVSGRIKNWQVIEGQFVKQGDVLVELEDNDATYLSRVITERDATFAKYTAAKAASETALLDLNRQKELFNQGISAKVKYEKAKIEYKKLLSIESSYASDLAKAESKLSRQQSQTITAPMDGHIQRIFYGPGSSFISEGTQLAVFVPESNSLGVELFVDANDLPLLSPGREVRLQFEGFPAFQVSGLPQLGVGTFPGEIFAIDSAVDQNGKIRLLVSAKKGAKWPSSLFIRQGSRVQGHVQLNVVKLGYELWRQFNGLPADLNISSSLDALSEQVCTHDLIPSNEKKKKSKKSNKEKIKE